MANWPKRILSFLADIHALEKTGGTFWIEPPHENEDEPSGETEAIQENQQIFRVCAQEVVRLLEKDARLIADPDILKDLVRVATHNPMALSEEFGKDERDFPQIIRSYVYLDDTDAGRTGRANHLFDLFMEQRRPASDLSIWEAGFADESLTRLADDPSLERLLGAMNAVLMRGEKLTCFSPWNLQDENKRQALPLYWLQTDETGQPSPKLTKMQETLALIQRAEGQTWRLACETPVLAQGIAWVRALPTRDPTTRALSKGVGYLDAASF